MSKDYLRCECGGIIGSYNRGNFCICERCKKDYPFYTLKYDIIKINEETGWVFPMIEI